MNYKWCVSGAVHTGQGERNMDYIAREDALVLLKRYNQDPFHLQHAFTVEAVMKWYANELGYAEDAEYWGIVGLLHDIDFEQYPEEHCLKAPELLREAGVGEDIIHAVVSHGYGITVGCGATIETAPEHEMEKVLFAADELTGLIWAAALAKTPISWRSWWVNMAVSPALTRLRNSLKSLLAISNGTAKNLAMPNRMLPLWKVTLKSLVI